MVVMEGILLRIMGFLIALVVLTGAETATGIRSEAEELA